MKKTLIIILLICFTCLIASAVFAAPSTPELSALNALNLTSKPETMQILVGGFIKGILGVTGSFAFLMVVYGGLTLLTSHGDQQNIAKGKKVLTWAVIGTFVTIGSYILVSFILTAYQGGGGSGSDVGAPPATDKKCASFDPPDDYKCYDSWCESNNKTDYISCRDFALESATLGCWANVKEPSEDFAGVPCQILCLNPKEPLPNGCP